MQSYASLYERGKQTHVEEEVIQIRRRETCGHKPRNAKSHQAERGKEGFPLRASGGSTALPTS